MAAEVNDGKRFPVFRELGERWDGAWINGGRVGLPGSELLSRGDFGGPSPAAASVKRNSTQSRENDCCVGMTT